ncbi:MAG: hypothetical protein ACR2NM_08745 [Bythopirellula sp.]
MTNSATTNVSDIWRLDATKAVLCTPQLTAEVDLLNPHAGLHRLEFGEATIDGSVLGIGSGPYPAPQQGDLADKFVRGHDLVVSYAETRERPFSLQIYWRATTSQQGVLLLDTILSLQTALLESFPGVAVETKLPNSQHYQLPVDGADAYLVRCDGCSWSYAESTHPDDAGESQVKRSDAGASCMVRQLGGRFLEKGVIRRIRVRGVILPRENDEMVATDCLESLSREEPPLAV